MRKSRVFALLVSTILLFGMSTAMMGAATPSTFPMTINGHIMDNTSGVVIGSVDFQENYEVYMKLTVDNPLPETDLDMQIVSPEGEIVYWAGMGYNYLGNPEIIEEGYFWVPVGGTYVIYMDGYYVPDPAGVDYELYINSAEELIDNDPLEPNGLSVGALTSYINNNPNAKLKSSDRAPFHDVESTSSAQVVFGNIAVTNSWTPYTLTPLRICTNDAVIVGGVVWELPASMFGSYKEARDYMVLNYENYIDGIPLSELVNVKTGPVQKVIQNGEVVSYRKVLEFGVFEPGKLVELIGEGQHYVLIHLTGPDLDIPWVEFYFWLLPEGSTGPYH